MDGIEYLDGELYCIHHAEGRMFPRKQTAQQEQNNDLQILICHLEEKNPRP